MFISRATDLVLFYEMSTLLRLFYTKASHYFILFHFIYLIFFIIFAINMVSGKNLYSIISLHLIISNNFQIKCKYK